jgi:hypothetical protein
MLDQTNNGRITSSLLLRQCLFSTLFFAAVALLLSAVP